MYAGPPAHVGAWYNSLSDLWGDIEQGASALTGSHGGGGPPGFGVPPGFHVPGATDLPPGARPYPLTLSDSQDQDDLQKIAAWAQSVTDSGSRPTRVPGTMMMCGLTQCSSDSVGKLAQRINGPYTNHPEHGVPYTYVLAPDDVLAADARVSGNDTLAQALGSIIPADVIGLNNTLQSLEQRYLPYVIGGVALLVFLELRR